MAQKPAQHCPLADLFHKLYGPRSVPKIPQASFGGDAQGEATLTEDMQRKATRPTIRNEADNGLSNRTGTIAMARTPDPHSASAQFFINVKDNDFLDHRAKTAKGWGYCVFGRVIGGMNVVRAIENVPTTARSGMRDVPRTPVVIVQALVVPADNASKKQG